MPDLQYKIGLDGSQADATISRVTGGVGRLGAALGALGVTAFGVGFLKRGLDFNRTMNDSEAAIAKVLAQFQGLNDEAAKGEAAKAMAQLVALEPKAAGTLNTLVDGFLATLAASQSAGISVAQNIDLVGRFANALANANIPTEQLAQEMRSILTANIGADSTLAKVLGITTETARAALESGRMYDFLVQKIGKLGEAGDTAAVAFSSLESALDKAAGALAAPLFEQVLAGAKDFTVVVEDLTPQLERLGGGIGQLVVWAKDAAAAFTDFGTAIGVTAATYVAMFRDGLDFDTALERSLENLRQLEQARRDEADAARQQQAADKAADTPAPLTGTGGGKGGPSDIDRRQRQRDVDESRNSLLGELAILEQQARGHDKKARQIERQLQIERDKLQIIKETGASEEQALRLAQRKADLEDRLDRRQNGQRSHIGGVKSKQFMSDRQGGPLSNNGPLTANGGIDGFRRNQEKVETDTRSPALPGYRRGQLVPRFFDSLSGRAAQRVGAAVMPAAANEGKAAQTADPVPGKLDKILSELTRIRTA